MSGLQAVADRVEVEALRGEFTGAVMMNDHDRLASLFTQDAVLRMPNIPPSSSAGRRSAPWASGGRLSWSTSADHAPGHDPA
jgi:hypothetical protein